MYLAWDPKAKACHQSRLVVLDLKVIDLSRFKQAAKVVRALGISTNRILRAAPGIRWDP